MSIRQHNCIEHFLPPDIDISNNVVLAKRELPSTRSIRRCRRKPRNIFDGSVQNQKRVSFVHREVAFHVLASNIVGNERPICKTTVRKTHGYVRNIGPGQLLASSLSVGTQASSRKRAIHWRLGKSLLPIWRLYNGERVWDLQRLVRVGW